MREYQIWSEGYQISGNDGEALLHGVGYGVTFREAVFEFALLHPEFNRYFDMQKLTFYGCRLFEDEKGARAAFG